MFILTKEILAKDLACEIVLGTDRFDRNDFRDFVREKGFDAKELRELTKNYIEENFQKDDIYGVAPESFVKSELDFWFEGLL